MLKLIIGNKKYSSWSLRPWLAMKVKDVEFEEVIAPFDLANDSRHFYDFSPSKKVPILHDGDLRIWDSLAILEYLAELTPEKNWWPQDQRLRAQARAIANEMHGGFAALRAETPMNVARTPSPIIFTERGAWEFERIEKIWESALSVSGGPFLYGEFSIADAMYAPIVSRIRSYQLGGGDAVRSYSKAIQALPAWAEWMAAGAREPWVVNEVEI